MSVDLLQLYEFDQFVSDVGSAATADQRQAHVDWFVLRYPHSPLVGDDEAIIWYCGPGSTVVLRGDMLQERSEQLQRLVDTSFHYYRASYEPDARLDYHLLVDEEDIGDPRNQRQVPSGYGPRAELVMPRYKESQRLHVRGEMERGTLQIFEAFPSDRYGTTHTVWVYLPAQYTASKRYSSLYFHDGGDYLNFAHAATLLDNLIADQRLPPCIAIFVDPSNEHGRVIDYDLNPLYMQFISDELVPWIDQRYSTVDSPRHRAIIGASFGGLISLYTALHRPDVFNLVVGQSSFASRRDDAIIELFRALSPQPLRLHLTIGTYETHVGPFERGALEADFLRGNRLLRDVLVERGYNVAYSEYHEGHSWGLWRSHLGEALEFMLR
jgi:enterochelin esterase family protein